MISEETPDRWVINANVLFAPTPPPQLIVVMDDAGAVILSMKRTEDGRIDVEGDESRWTEACARFVAEIRRLFGVTQ